MVRLSLKWWSTTMNQSDFTVPSAIPLTHFCIWARGVTWRWHTGKHGSSAPHHRVTQPTSWPHMASPTWSSTEQVTRPAPVQLETTGGMLSTVDMAVWWPSPATQQWWWWWLAHRSVGPSVILGHFNLSLRPKSVTLVCDWKFGLMQQAYTNWNRPALLASMVSPICRYNEARIKMSNSSKSSTWFHGHGNVVFIMDIYWCKLPAYTVSSVWKYANAITNVTITAGTVTRTASIQIRSQLKALAVNLSWPSSWRFGCMLA